MKNSYTTQPRLFIHFSFPAFRATASLTHRSYRASYVIKERERGKIYTRAYSIYKNVSHETAPKSPPPMRLTPMSTGANSSGNEASIAQNWSRFSDGVFRSIRTKCMTRQGSGEKQIAYSRRLAPNEFIGVRVCNEEKKKIGTNGLSERGCRAIWRKCTWRRARLPKGVRQRNDRQRDRKNGGDSPTRTPTNCPNSKGNTLSTYIRKARYNLL